MVLNSQRTLYNIDLHCTQLMGQDYNPAENTTLNEKFRVMASSKCPSGKYPLLKYFAIGCGGSQMIAEADSYPVSEHSPLDAALFSHIPFCMRKASEDLTSAEAAKYRFRVPEVINGVAYISYYLRVIPGMSMREEYYRIRTVNGHSSLSLFKTDTSEFLNPKPRSRALTIDKLESTELFTKLMKIEFTLMPNELEELNRVFAIKKIKNAHITEIGLCTGLDMPGTLRTEAICTQIAFHVGVNIDLINEFKTSLGINKIIEIGGSEGYTVGQLKE